VLEGLLSEYKALANRLTELGDPQQELIEMQANHRQLQKDISMVSETVRSKRIERANLIEKLQSKLVLNRTKLQEKYDEKNQETYDAESTLASLQEAFDSTSRRIDEIGWLRDEKMQLNRDLDGLFQSLSGEDLSEFPEKKEAEAWIIPARKELQRLHIQRANRQEALEMLISLKTAFPSFLDLLGKEVNKLGQRIHEFFNVYIQARNKDLTLPSLHILPELRDQLTPISQYEFNKAWQRYINQLTSAQTTNHSMWVMLRRTILADKELLAEHEQRITKILDKPSEEIRSAEAHLAAADEQLRQVYHGIFALLLSSRN